MNISTDRLKDIRIAILGAGGVARAAVAELAAEANGRMENIGARRLMTIIECVFEDISFKAPELAGKKKTSKVIINAEFVRERLFEIMKDEDLSRFVL